jgi:hypothetical protein
MRDTARGVTDLVDRRTTPRWLQPLALLFLLAVALYFVTANRWALENGGAPRWIARNPAYTWFGGWKMFTELDKSAARLDAEIEVAGSWQPIDLEAIFPTMWESGPRYARSWFRNSPAAMRVLAHSTCVRTAELHPDRVRFTQLTWQKQLGRAAAPPEDAKQTLILDWDCSQTVPLPHGRRI